MALYVVWVLTVEGGAQFKTLLFNNRKVIALESLCLFFPLYISSS